MQFYLLFKKLQSCLALAGVALFLLVLMCGCRSQSPEEKKRVVVEYWDKWTGFEADAMRAVVEDFNAGQDRIFVRFTSMSQIDRKLMLATAGGLPPDVAGLYSYLLPIYSENNALIPLDKMAAASGVNPVDYIDVFWEMCHYRGYLWALPSTPGSVGLVWNKKMFREAGLDPERPPESIAELEKFNEKLTRWRPDGTLEAVGHLPEEPGWWRELWGYWFGGELWDGLHKITADSPANIAAYKWIESYPKRFGPENLLAFREGFGNFASPQNPFFTGRVAMVLQGEWIYNFIEKFAPPGFEWGVAAFPSVDPEHLKNVAIVESDVLAIPAGAKHPKE
ncbi:MAG: extracellular solute-binding protein, partial [Verrucomicrobiota bacterium]